MKEPEIFQTIETLQIKEESIEIEKITDTAVNLIDEGNYINFLI